MKRADRVCRVDAFDLVTGRHPDVGENSSGLPSASDSGPHRGKRHPSFPGALPDSLPTHDSWPHLRTLGAYGESGV
jgi:hypothetical protein